MKDLYRMVRRTGPDYGKTHLLTDPYHSTIDERISFTRDVWGERWKSNKDFQNRPAQSMLAPITGDKVRRVIRYMSDNKAKGKDGWPIPELRALRKADTDALAQFYNNAEAQRRWPNLAGAHYCAA